MSMCLPTRAWLSFGFRPFAVLAIGLSLVALSACSKPESDRQASGGNLGTRVCLTNATSKTVNINFETKDTATAEGAIQPGSQACAEGTFATDFDVLGYVNQGDPGQLLFGARNPWAGAPRFGIYRSIGSSVAESICTASGWDVGEQHSMTTPDFLVTVTRLPDDRWKEFTVSLADANAPQSAGAGDADAVIVQAAFPPPVAASWLKGC
jgi:hypothetical protein